MPRIVLSAPVRFGPEELVERLHASDWSALVSATPSSIEVGGIGFDMAWTGPDPRIEAAFRAAMDPQRPTLTDRELAAIAGHAHVVRVAGEVTDDDARMLKVADQTQLLAVALLDAGAVGVKCDSSGLAHGRKGWASLMERTRRALQQHHSGEEDAVFPLFGGRIDTLVRRPIADGTGAWCTRGMHLLGRAEAAVTRDVLPSNDDTLKLLDAFTLYLAAEAPPDELRDGHTFRMHADALRFSLSHEDSVHAADHLFHNPRGTWRLVPDRDKG